mgnify:CR=1 FL=1
MNFPDIAVLLIGEHQRQLKNLCSRQGELVGMEVMGMQYCTSEKWVDSTGYFCYQTSGLLKKESDEGLSML